MIERMVLFGASGDLTSRLLLPAAVAQLAEDELLPDGFSLVGSDITDWSTDDFREHIAAKLREHADVMPATMYLLAHRSVPASPLPRAPRMRQ